MFTWQRHADVGNRKFLIPYAKAQHGTAKLTGGTSSIAEIKI
jgi:hypothetical protein